MKNTQDQSDRRSLREFIAVRDNQVQNRKTQANAVATVVMARSEAAPPAPAPPVVDGAGAGVVCDAPVVVLSVLPAVVSVFTVVLSADNDPASERSTTR